MGLKASFPPFLSLSLASGLGTNGPCRAHGGKGWFENLLPDSSAIRQRVQPTLSGPPAPAPFDLLTAVGRDASGACKLLHSMKTSGLDRHRRRTPLRAGKIGQVLRGVVAPPRPGSSAQQQKELRLTPSGAREDGPAPTTHLFQAADWGNGRATEDFLPGHRNPRQKRKYEKQGDLASVGDQCLSAQSSAAEDLRTFWPSAHGPAADPSGRSPPIAATLGCLRAGAGAAANWLHPGFRAGLRGCGRYLRQPLPRLSRPIPTPQALVAGFEKLLSTI